MVASPPAPFPALALPDLDGVTQPLSAAWATGPALVLVGHGGCDTTRFTLPYVDRLSRRRGSGVVAVLQDDRADALALRERWDLRVPIRLEAPPYPLAAALDLKTVPTLFLVGPEGRIEAAIEAFRRDELERAARRLGLTEPLFTPEDRAPELRPG